MIYTYYKYGDLCVRFQIVLSEQNWKLVKGNWQVFDQKIKDLLYYKNGWNIQTVFRYFKSFKGVLI